MVGESDSLLILDVQGRKSVLVARNEPPKEKSGRSLGRTSTKKRLEPYLDFGCLIEMDALDESYSSRVQSHDYR